jgi:hypothetical protein
MSRGFLQHFCPAAGGWQCRVSDKLLGGIAAAMSEQAGRRWQAVVDSGSSWLGLGSAYRPRFDPSSSTASGC